MTTWGGMPLERAKQMYPLGGNTSYAHEANNNCTDDAYILASAKQIIAKRFNLRQKPFLIGVISKLRAVKK